MKKNRYRVTLERMDENGTRPDNTPLSFTAHSHDEIFALVARSRQLGLLEADDGAVMVFGLKLPGEIAIEKRQDPRFSELFQDLGRSIKKLKTAD